jgi:hypothetical protein
MYKMGVGRRESAILSCMMLIHVHMCISQIYYLTKKIYRVRHPKKGRKERRKDGGKTGRKEGRKEGGEEETILLTHLL